ncbi:unnamed protein product [Prunus armeniaca]|uniref:Uncharacterized protein n=1 Tax=Prunus armeniaca TaxID=36596 RepID=A0A6J5U373_PRUAR|nr:unnamed protein product [Prunus armeniaca]
MAAADFPAGNSSERTGNKTAQGQILCFDHLNRPAHISAMLFQQKFTKTPTLVNGSPICMLLVLGLLLVDG